MAISHSPEFFSASTDAAFRFSREALLGVLFQETDRVQRMKTSLSLILVEVLLDAGCIPDLDLPSRDDAHEAVLHDLSRRLEELLRSYDRMGRTGKSEFLLLLPGCALEDARTLAARIRAEVFGKPFVLGAAPVRLAACFGITASYGRSPVVVLREAETALQRARGAGPDSIESF